MTYYRDWTKGMVHVGFAERLYRLPPSDPPQVLSKDEKPTYNTLAVGGHTTDFPAIARTFTALGGFYDSKSQKWLFQESPNAPAASAHPPPENDDDPALRPRHRTFDVPRTVPIGTHDKVLFFLGGVQRCDLPLHLRPMVLDPEASAVSSAVTPAAPDANSGGGGDGPRRKKAARTEAAQPAGTADAPQQQHQCIFSDYSSRHPAVEPVESRVYKGAAKSLSADVLRQLLTLRSSTAVTGSKGTQARSLEHMGSRDSYHTYAYRRYVHEMVRTGAMPLVATAAESTTAAAPLSVADALASLPWGPNGEVRPQPTAQ